MVYFRNATIACVAALTLSACGGSTTPATMTPVGPVVPVTPVTPVTPARTFAQIETAANTLGQPFVELVRTNNEYPQSSFPRTGSATYNGFLGANIASQNCSSDDCRSGRVNPPAFELNGGGIIGEMTVNADFATRMMTGTASSFVDQSNGAVAGTLTMSPERFPANRTNDPAINADLDGTLTPSSGVSFRVNAVLEGDFYGNTAPALPGAMAGQMTGTIQRTTNTLNGSAAQEAGVIGQFESGEFIATR